MKIVFLGTGTSTGNPEIGCQCEVCTSKDPRAVSYTHLTLPTILLV